MGSHKFILNLELSRKFETKKKLVFTRRLCASISKSKGRFCLPASPAFIKIKIIILLAATWNSLGLLDGMSLPQVGRFGRFPTRTLLGLTDKTQTLDKDRDHGLGVLMLLL